MNYEPILSAIVLLFLFWTVNRKRKERYTQWKIAALAITLYVFFLYLYFDLYVFHTELGETLKTFQETIVQSPGFQEYFTSIQTFLPDNTVSAAFIQGHKNKIILVNELLLLSLLGIICFLAIKILINGFCAIKNKLFKTKKSLNAISSLFYEKKHGKIYLKNQYVVPGITAKYFGSLLLFITFVLPIAGVIVYGELSLEFFWPPLILLSAVLLMEIGFFFGGEYRESRYGSINIEVDNVDIISQFDILYRKYQQELNQKILSGYIVKDLNGKSNAAPQHEMPRFDIGYFNNAAISIRREGKRPNNNYLQGLDKLFSWKQQGKKPNVLFSNAYDEQFEPYLNLFFEFSYLSNKKIIIPVLTQEDREATIKWIDESIGGNVFRVKDCDFFNYEDKRHHILVDTLESIMCDSTLKKYMSDFHFIVLFDLKNFIRKNHLYLNTFLRLYQAITGKTPQILGFSNIPNELEPSFNLIFVGANDDTIEIKIKKEQEKAFYLLVFDSSGKRFQDLLNLDKGLYLGREVPLAYFAYQTGGISPIIISSEASSIEEEMEELCKGIECSVGFKESIQQISNRNYNHIHNGNRLFIVDDYCNLPQTIQKWRNYAISNEVFLIIVSSPYLLRTYFTDNLPILMDDSEFYTELLPKGGLSKHEKAFMLLLSLSLNKLKKDEIDLEEVSREKIANFISDNIDKIEMHPSDIHVSIHREFDGESYGENIYYSISQKNYSPQIHYYLFETTQREELGICLEDDIYHKYNKGMLITLSGRAYRIIDFNHRRRVIIVEFIPTTPIPYYHIDKEIIFDHTYLDEEEILFNKEQNKIQLLSAYMDIDFHCVFYGYQEIDSAVKTILDDTPEYKYYKKRSLFLRFSRQEDFSLEFQNAFIYLMHEVLKVYLPHHHHLLGIKLEENHTDSTTFSIWLLEMSKINYHILSTIIEEKYFHKIFMLMEDVILWSRENNVPLAYGIHKEEAPDMDFDSLQEFLSQYLLGDNEITMNRHKKKNLVANNKTFQVDENPHYCDFCSVLLPLGQFERLADGRERCVKCSQETAGKKNISADTMLKDAMIYLEQKYGISIDQNINIEILSSKKLHAKIGQKQIISEKFDPRAVGIAVKDAGNKYILVENEAPYFREMSVLVHELTHIWQYDNLDIEDISEKMKVLEGHATYVELEFLKDKFAEQSAYIHSESARDDIYGIGYRYIRDFLENSNNSNIFSVLKDELLVSSNP